MKITEFLALATQAGASDLHLKSGNYPMMRVQGVTSTTGAAREQMAIHQPDDEGQPPMVTRFGD
jgi:Tfp pilus assembly pilus retraction ATPase PilT